MFPLACLLGDSSVIGWYYKIAVGHISSVVSVPVSNTCRLLWNRVVTFYADLGYGPDVCWGLYGPFLPLVEPTSLSGWNVRTESASPPAKISESKMRFLDQRPKLSPRLLTAHPSWIFFGGKGKGSENRGKTGREMKRAWGPGVGEWVPTMFGGSWSPCCESLWIVIWWKHRVGPEL